MEFSQQIARFNEKAMKRVESVFRGSALEIFKTIILRSPVKSGRFRGNWRTSINSSASGYDNKKDKAGSRSIRNAASTTSIAKIEDVIYMTNNLPYATRLENGHSKQAPIGMVKITVLEWNATVDAKNKGIL